MIGKEWSAADLLKEIYKDIDFFMDSDGGITLSGGEPLLQANFLFQWLPMVKEKKIHTIIETCGLADWKQIEKLLPWIDIVFYDLKHINDSIHKKYTGCGNAGILENFSRLSRSKSGLQARMPVIPGINNSVENIQATANFLKSNHHFSIHLLPYHNLGEAKLKRMYSQQYPMNIALQNSEQLKQTQELFEKEKIHAVLYD
jgi:pyruvate formate lyase activating enzyme